MCTAGIEFTHRLVITRIGVIHARVIYWLLLLPRLHCPTKCQTAEVGFGLN